MKRSPHTTTDIDFPEFDQHDDGWDDDEEPLRPFRGRMPLAPIRLVAAANALVGFGEERGDTGSASRGAFVDLMLGEMRIAPLDGDVYLLWSPARQAFVRSGIIVAIDGDSDAIAAAVGTKVLRSARVLSAAVGDRFIRWTAMDGRDENQEGINIAVDAVSFREAA